MSQSLTRRLGQRLAALAVGALLLQTVYVSVEYRRHPERLIKVAAEREMNGLIASLSRLPDIPQPLYREYPHAYAYEVRNARGERLFGSNASLLESLPVRQLNLDGLSGFDAEGARHYVMRRVAVEGVTYELSFVMIGDPANLAGEVLKDEIRDHVLMPILPLTFLLAFGLWLVVRRGLAPVERAAAAAADLQPGAARLSLDLADAPAEVAALGTAVNGLLARLQDAHAAQSEFTANVAHELRTPLALALLELDQVSGPAAAMARKDLRVMSRLIDQFLSRARLDAIAEMPREQVHLATLARSVVARLAPLAIAAGRTLALEVEAGHADAAIEGRPEAIAAALRNLIENALRHAPPGSTVTVEAGPGPRLAVRDAGPGIAVEERAHLFERFRQSGNGAGGKAGLGLAIVKRIMDLHQGEVSVTSTPGQGACFELRFQPSAPR